MRAEALSDVLEFVGHEIVAAAHRIDEVLAVATAARARGDGSAELTRTDVKVLRGSLRAAMEGAARSGRLCCFHVRSGLSAVRPQLEGQLRELGEIESRLATMEALSERLASMVAAWEQEERSPALRRSDAHP